MIGENFDELYKALYDFRLRPPRKSVRRRDPWGRHLTYLGMHVGNPLTSIPDFILTNDFDEPEQTIELCKHLIKCKELSG